MHANVLRVQALLNAAAEDARGEADAARFLACLEPWMLWLGRLVEEQEEAQLERERAAAAARHQPFCGPTMGLLRALLPCVVPVDGVRSCAPLLRCAP